MLSTLGPGLGVVPLHPPNTVLPLLQESANPGVSLHPSALRGQSELATLLLCAERAERGIEERRGRGRRKNNSQLCPPGAPSGRETPGRSRCGLGPHRGQESARRRPGPRERPTKKPAKAYNERSAASRGVNIWAGPRTGGRYVCWGGFPRGMTLRCTQPGYCAFNHARAKDFGGYRREEEGKGSNRSPSNELMNERTNEVGLSRPDHWRGT